MITANPLTSLDLADRLIWCLYGPTGNA